MHLIALAKLTLYLACWIFGCVIIPTAIICLYFNIWLPTYFLICYYSYRIIFPAKPSNWVREFLDCNSHPYFNSQTMIFDEGATMPEPGSSTIMTVAPHGLLCIGWGLITTSAKFCLADFTILVAPILLRLPLAADLMIFGHAKMCNKKTMVKLMKKKANIAFLPGGFEEASLYKRGHHRVYLQDRKGFIKYALRYGYKIQPVYIFGEELTYWLLEIFPEWLILWLNKMNIPCVVFTGKFGIIPDYNIDMSIIVGKPMALPVIENPSTEEIDKYHALYIEEVKTLFNKYKSKYAAQENAVLEVL